MYAVTNPCAPTSPTTRSILSQIGKRVWPGVFEIQRQKLHRLGNRTDVLVLDPVPTGVVALMIFTFKGKRARNLPRPCTPWEIPLFLPRNTKKVAVALTWAEYVNEAIRGVKRRYKYAEAEVIYADPARSTDAVILRSLGV